MAEQWIHSSQVHALGIDQRALCVRLHKGLLTATARSIHRDEESMEACDIPKWFWWAEGHEALEQDWKTGDFATWIDRTKYWQAFGVRFPLAGLLDMLPPERRPIFARSLSVAGNPDWITARAARALVYEGLGNSLRASSFIIEQGSLGFLAARAVQARGKIHNGGGGTPWEEREWDVPPSFWEALPKKESAGTDFELGNFSFAKGTTARGESVTLKGVHFFKESILAVIGQSAPTEQEQTVRGAKPKYDWRKASNAVWAKIYEGALIPSTQAEIEAALIQALSKGDVMPSESTVRPFARDIWKLFSARG